MNNELQIDQRIIGKCITISDYHLNAFSGLTLDFNPLHTDEEFAKRTRFKGRIAHGLLSLSMALGLISEFTQGYFLYGFDKVRFLDPLKPGDTVCSELKVSSSKERDDFTLFYCTLSLKKNDKLLVTSEIILGKDSEKNDRA